jgi:hypothetical protein
VKAVRAVLTAVILLNLALLAAAGPLGSTLSRYELSRKRAELRMVTQENQDLLRRVAESRRPDRVAARAAAMGLDLRMIDNETLADTAGRPAPTLPATAPAPRR